MSQFLCITGRCTGSLIKYGIRTSFFSNSSILNYPVVATILQNRHQCTQNPKSENRDVLVYHGTLTSQIRAVKLLTLSSSMAGILCQPFIYKQISSFGSLANVIAVYTFVGVFTCVTPFLLHSITRKYVTDIYFDDTSGEYTATVYTFFLKKKMMKFTPDDVRVPDLPGMFTSFYVKEVPVFIDPQLFEDPEHYANIMGFNKPLDFKLGKNDSCDTKKQD